MSRFRPIVTVTLFAGLLSACSERRPGEVAGPDRAGSDPVHLSDAYASPRILGEAVLEALRAGDREALQALRVTRQEYLELFWPELPESDDTPFDFVWQLNDDHSRVGIRQAVELYGGEDFDLISLRFTEPPEVYSTFTVHFGAELRVRRVSDGREGTLPILSVVVERQGLWKLLTFRED